MKKRKLKPVRQDMIRAYETDKEYLEAMRALGSANNKKLNNLLKKIITDWYNQNEVLDKNKRNKDSAT